MNEENYQELYKAYQALSETMIISTELTHTQLKDLQIKLEGMSRSNYELNLATQSFNKCINKLIEKYGTEAEKIVNEQLKEDGLLYSEESEKGL